MTASGDLLQNVRGDFQLSAGDRPTYAYLTHDRIVKVSSLHRFPLFGSPRSDKDMIALELGSAVVLIMLLAEQCNIDLPLAVLRKIELNAKKYPAALVRYCLYKLVTQSIVL